MGIELTAQLFQRDAHAPSFESICSTLPKDHCPIDFCVPVNRHFPPAHLLTDIRHDLPDIVKYYPSYADAHQAVLAELIDQPADYRQEFGEIHRLAWHQAGICGGPSRQSEEIARPLALLEHQWSGSLRAAASSRHAR